jgi:SnoaL-like domain
MKGDVMPSREELETIAKRWIDEGWRKGDANAVLEMYAPAFVDLSSPYGERGTREQNAQGIRALYAAFPDFYTEISDLIVDVGEGKVAVRWSATGTQIAFHGIETLSIADGLIVERAGEWDGLEILRQISEVS